MQFIKKHFEEKINFSVVLASLGGAAVWLSVAVRRPGQVDRDSPRRRGQTLMKGRGGVQQCAAAMTNAPEVVLTGEHNLFNWGWIKLKDGNKESDQVGGGRAVGDGDPAAVFQHHAGLAGERRFLIIGEARLRPGADPLVWEAGGEGKAAEAVSNRGTNSAPDKPNVMVLQMQIPDTGETVNGIQRRALPEAGRV